MTTLAPTLMPDAQPVDVIVSFLQQDSDIPVELWKYCADEWQVGYYAFDPENYFREQGEPTVEEEIATDLDDSDPESDDDEPITEDEIEEEQLTDREITPEIQEQIVIHAPLIQALKEFWTSLMVFTTDNPTVTGWAKMCENMERFIAYQPVDRARLIRHVYRINLARQEAEALVPHTTGFATNTVLLDILNQKFD